MTILVTGGLGYIGSHTVVELIANGYNPVIVDNLSNSNEKVLTNIEKIAGKKVPFYKIDCRNQVELASVFKKHKIYGVIHFAALKSVNESVSKPQEYFDVNVTGLLSLTKQMEKYAVRKLIFSSSCTVYGQPDTLPVTEQQPFKEATSPYGRTKQICEFILRDLHNINSIALRYFNPIGAHPSGLIGELPNGVPNNLVPYITQTAVGQREELKVFGNDYSTIDGTCIRDFIHVVDLAKAHVKALSYLNDQKETTIHGLALNIGTGNGHSVLELLKTFEKVNDLKLNYSFAPRRDGDIEKIYADSRYSNDVLGWKSEKSLSDALQDAWRWERRLRTSAKE